MSDDLMYGFGIIGAKWDSLPNIEIVPGCQVSREERDEDERRREKREDRKMEKRKYVDPH